MKPIRIELRPGTKSYEALLSLQKQPKFKDKPLSYIVAVAVSQFNQHGNFRHETDSTVT